LFLAVAGAGCASAAAPTPASIATAATSAPAATSVPASPGVAEPTPVPNPSSSADVVVTLDFAPPAPLCPGPLGQVDPPGVRVRIADGAPIAATMGSFGLQTCGTSGEYDVGDLTYPAPLVALAGDELTFAVDPGWQILWFEAFDHPKRGDGGGMTPGVRVAGGPAEVSIPVPGRSGDMTVGMDMWVVRDDGKVTARIEPIVWVQSAGE
jgi:hypothetical protein